MFQNFQNAYNFANVGMKPDHNGWNIFVHLHNKKVLKYGEQGELGVSYCWGLSMKYLIVNYHTSFQNLMKI